MKRTTNPELFNILKLLKWQANKSEAAIWDTIAKKLKKSKHNRISINISRINRHSTENETVVVPGKVLSSGSVRHKVTVAALSFSKQAREKIEKAGGECLTIDDLIYKNPQGSGIRIIG